ncbi:LysR substrate-binding domain-containing protein [Marinomonas sp.]|nr:LysR substrate-binding domain-containing protein [Marinomonas sp.]MDB4837455.1 LysR substrate-binding domain-containing protein [Marinomonas sp.]
MELSDLKVFTQVVNSGGITSAAEALHRVPSNVTARIKKLEDILGKKLFIREKNRLRISPAGEQLLPYAEKLLSLAQETLIAMGDTSVRGPFKLGAMEAVAATRLIQPMMKFHQSYPDVELEVKTAPTGELISRVLEGDIDLALVADPPKDNRLHCIPIFEEQLVVVSHLSHKKIKGPEDLGTSPTIMGFSSACAYRNRLNDWIERGSNICKVVEVNSYHAMLSCVVAGMGIGILPVALLENYPFADSIKVHPLSNRLSRSVTYFIWRNENEKAAIAAFVGSVEGNVD